MSELWIVLGICVVVVMSAALPLLRDRDSRRAPPPPPKETLRDWRSQSTGDKHD